MKNDLPLRNPLKRIIMKTFLQHLTLLALMLFGISQAEAQKANYTTNGGLTLGFGIGGSYQQSDVLNSSGYGFDFTLGHHIYKKEGAFFATDWKFRFLRGENFTYDHRVKDDGTYNNVRYDFFNYDLEFGLTLNRLRERTRIVLTGFAGVGLTHGRTFFDLKDGFNDYDYSVINPNNSRQQVYQDLLELSDNDFETRGVNKAAVLPTLGVFVGYQFSRNFSLGIEHKTNYSLTENNSLIGINMDGVVAPDSPIDRNHYTALAFKWSLGGGGRATGTTTTNTTTNYTQPRPTVKIFDPGVNPYTTTMFTHTIRAKVHNVAGYSNIAFYQDGGKNVNFTYNATTNDFTANVFLHDGGNTFRIVASNTAGSAEDNVTIFVERPIVQLPPPIVNITLPNANPFTTNSSVIDVVANIYNVRYKEDIQVVFNGYNIGFDYFMQNNTVKTTLNLLEGNNYLVITGVNEVGADSDNLTIIYNKPIQPTPPAVKITTPSVAPATVTVPGYLLEAQTLNVKTKQDVTVKVNGVSTTYFSFNTSGVVTVNVALNEGSNTVEVTGRNEFGTASDATTIIYNKPMVIAPPIVTILVPETSPYNTYESKEDVIASVLNVTSKNQITVSINGNLTSNFNYNTSNSILNTNVSLNEGYNVVTITAKNEAGQDSKTQVIIKEIKPCPQPTVNLIQPTQNPFKTENQAQTIVLNTTNAKSVKVTYQGENFSDYTFNQSTGQVVITIDITKARNLIDVYVSNECGSVTKHIIVDYDDPRVTPPCKAPVVLLMSSVNETVQNAQYTFTAQVQNITSTNQLTLTVNGKASNFIYDAASKQVSAGITLTAGVNNLVLIAQNECGAEIKAAEITYTPVVVEEPEPCFPPVVNFTITEVNRNDASHELVGTITNIKNKNDVTITVDGRADNGFQFVPNTTELSSKYKLQPGTHTIVVTAKNECGQDAKSFTIVVQEPCIPPVVNFTVTAVNRNDASHELIGTIANVKNKSDISITVNGSADNGFQYVPNINELSTKFKFKPGTYTIVVKAKNDCGEDTKTTTVTVEEPCVPPVVNFNVTAVNRNDASHELTGTITNVKNKSDVTLTVNGSPDNGFQYVPNTNELNTKFKFKPGTYTIVVTAKNECGADSKTITVTVEEPCLPPTVNFNLITVNRNDASHELKGTVTNVKNKNNITVTVNGKADNGFQFTANTGEISSKYKFEAGTHDIVVIVKNECGEEMKAMSISIDKEIEQEPCLPPVINFSVTAVNRNDASHELNGTITNVKNKSDVTLTVNGSPDNGFQYVPNTNELNTKFKFKPGTHTIVVTAKNECGSDTKTITVTVEEPCVPPVVNFTVTAVNRNDASHELSGTITNVKNKSDVTLTVNGKADNGFQYNPNTGELSAKFKLSAGTHTIVVKAKNACGEDTKTFNVTIEEDACGPRINPGNSDWQFCLITPKGTFNRENLASNGFTYSGAASSLFIMPIAGGGDAIVNGKPYKLNSGQYYLFTGNMTVTVSTTNPGSMGHWSVCIDTDTAPTFGNGNNRPKSPCEVEEGGQGGGSGGNSGGSGSGNQGGNQGGQGGGNNSGNQGGQGGGNTGNRGGNNEGDGANNAQRSQQNTNTQQRTTAPSQPTTRGTQNNTTRTTPQGTTRTNTTTRTQNDSTGRTTRTTPEQNDKKEEAEEKKPTTPQRTTPNRTNNSQGDSTQQNTRTTRTPR
jgi:large repetitive protein